MELSLPGAICNSGKPEVRLRDFLT
ncbi:MAG: hypothetical protein RLZZ200_570, partial [Pseudomonadota bacterium]